MWFVLCGTEKRCLIRASSPENLFSNFCEVASASSLAFSASFRIAIALARPFFSWDIQFHSFFGRVQPESTSVDLEQKEHERQMQQ